MSARLIVDDAFLCGALGLPEGTRIESIQFCNHAFHGSWEFVISHREFPPQQADQPLPLAQLHHTKHAPKISTTLAVGKVELKGEVEF